MAASELPGPAEPTPTGAAAPQVPPAPVCQTYHIDFVRCSIRKSFARPDGALGAV